MTLTLGPTHMKNKKDRWTEESLNQFWNLRDDLQAGLHIWRKQREEGIETMGLWTGLAVLKEGFLMRIEGNQRENRNLIKLTWRQSGDVFSLVTMEVLYQLQTMGSAT